MNNIKTFWEQKHRAKDKATLSGCGYQETIDFLGVAPFIKKGVKVLEIGVGLGFVTKGLYNAGAIVTALDISSVALNNVAPYCEYICLATDAHSLNTDYYDVIICHNVIQHIPTETLIVELREVIRSLKSDGIFAVEFVSNDNFIDNGFDATPANVQRGSLCRSIPFMRELILSLGGICNLYYSVTTNFKNVHGCHIFHVTSR